MDLRLEGVRMPIKASGGITSVKRVRLMKTAGADAIEIATVLIVRPWRVKAILKCAEKIFNLEIK